MKHHAIGCERFGFASAPEGVTITNNGTAPLQRERGGINSAASATAKQACEAGINNNPALDPSKRSALSSDRQAVATAAASGNTATFKAAYTKYCGDLAAALPAAAQSAAKAACDQSASAIPSARPAAPPQD
jgi:hypothetical protein